MKKWIERVLREVIEAILAELLIKYEDKIVSWVEGKAPEMADEVDELITAVVEELNK